MPVQALVRPGGRWRTARQGGDPREEGTGACGGDQRQVEQSGGHQCGNSGAGGEVAGGGIAPDADRRGANTGTSGTPRISRVATTAAMAATTDVAARSPTNGPPPHASMPLPSASPRRRRVASCRGCGRSGTLRRWPGSVPPVRPRQLLVGTARAVGPPGARQQDVLQHGVRSRPPGNRLRDPARASYPYAGHRPRLAGRRRVPDLIVSHLFLRASDRSSPYHRRTPLST